ncbi:MAG TPA: glutaredoxin family protein [Deltaproteobacteria bacterium]|nr:glutaredoxin family protein [Deltaproteobacteria bacterium]
MGTSKLIVEVYARKDCCNCKEANEVIGRVNEDIPFRYKVVDITKNDDLFRRYKEDVPTIYINGKKAFKFKVDENEFRKRVRKEIIRESMTRLWNKKQHYS